nr:hypothetical protein [Tanacetum cinerariifolium]
MAHHVFKDVIQLEAIEVQRTQRFIHSSKEKVEEENGVSSGDEGVDNESGKDDVDESKEKEDAIEKMNTKPIQRSRWCSKM